jgi:thiamine-monophosphate kinase
LAAGEFDLIRWLERETVRAPRGALPSGHVVLGIGDDAALWNPPPGHAAVLTVDAQVEGVHFRPGWLTPGEIGARAVSVSASDLAAMAARPAGVLLDITLPRGRPESFFRALYRGALAEARRLGLAVLGGNISAGPLQVSVTSIGAARPASALRRAGARPGDGIYVTGWPGRAAIGRSLLARRGRARARTAGAAGKRCLRAFVAPRARIAEALEIARAIRPRSMVDLSDGLTQDLAHILERSSGRTGAILDEWAIVDLIGDGGVAALCWKSRIDPLAAALAGGEDYELLFTAPPGRAERGAPAFRRRFGIPLTRIGAVIASEGIFLGGDGPPRRIQPRGYDHFGGQSPQKG